MWKLFKLSRIWIKIDLGKNIITKINYVLKSYFAIIFENHNDKSIKLYQVIHKNNKFGFISY